LEKKPITQKPKIVAVGERRLRNFFGMIHGGLLSGWRKRNRGRHCQTKRLSKITGLFRERKREVKRQRGVQEGEEMSSGVMQPRISKVTLRHGNRVRAGVEKKGTNQSIETFNL